LLAFAPLALFFGVKRARPAIAGFAFGVAGFLVARGVLGSLDVMGFGHGVLDHAWLIGNGLVAGIIGKLALKRD
jgi:hypothetical protein